MSTTAVTTALANDLLQIGCTPPHALSVAHAVAMGDPWNLSDLEYGTYLAVVKDGVLGAQYATA